MQKKVGARYFLASPYEVQLSGPARTQIFCFSKRSKNDQDDETRGLCRDRAEQLVIRSDKE
jgi:hypothetical protein